jgi:GT2 family glycosyltransferase
MAEGEAPRASIIIPVYNLRDFVGDAIESALAQTLPREQFEVIVVDDGSTDGSDDVIRRFLPHVRAQRQANRGLSAARNAGIHAARGAFLAFLDADDRFLPEKLAASLAVFAARPELGLVYSGVRYIDARGAALPPRGGTTQEGDLLPALLLGNLIHPNAVVVRREPVERAGGFDESLTSLEDWDLWLRLSAAGLRWGCLDRPLAEYRIRADAMHQNRARMAENTLRVLDKLFAGDTLPAEVRDRERLAYQHAYLSAAADCYRAADRDTGAAWFRRAAATRPQFLGEARSLRRFCRLLLPPESQDRRAMARDTRGLAPTLRLALHDLYATPDLEPSIRRMRGRARLAYGQTVLWLVRSRLLSRAGAAR